MIWFIAVVVAVIAGILYAIGVAMDTEAPH